ncbi:MAG TPA: efflux RND transporter periplasmic adaptor subunit [Blastocatellia bacterium]|nr:efflux RND transporter periplasmic adaptor subunit [Blastocatellia bacterium]
MSKRRAAIVSCVLLESLLLIPAFVTLVLSSNSPNGNSENTTQSVSQDGKPADISRVTKGDIKKTLLLDGELRAVSSRTIFSSTSEEAKITYLPPEGTIVKAGERVVELDNSAILSRITDTEERIIAAENDIDKTKSQHEGALRDMEVTLSTLWLAYEQSKLDVNVPTNVIPRRKYQENQLAYDKGKTEYENQLSKIEQKKKEQAAELQVKIIEKEKLNVRLNQIKANLASMTLTAPADGMVIYGDHWMERRKIQVGDMVWGGFPLVRLPDLKEMEVLAQVNEVDGPRLSVGQKAHVRLDSYPDVEITGSVKNIAQTAIKASWMAKAKVFLVVISLEKTVTEIMKPGMSAQIALSVAAQPSQLLVPRSAVHFEAGAPQVMRLDGEKDRRAIAVTVLSADPKFYSVAEDGLIKEGDRILNRWDKEE